MTWTSEELIRFSNALVASKSFVYLEAEVKFRLPVIDVAHSL
jgi:hypothetical protein